MDIQQLMEQAELTQADLAKHTNLTESYISRILSGERAVPSVVEKYEMIASKLGISLEELIQLLRDQGKANGK